MKTKRLQVQFSFSPTTKKKKDLTVAAAGFAALQRRQSVIQGFLQVRLWKSS